MCVCVCICKLSFEFYLSMEVLLYTLSNFRFRPLYSARNFPKLSLQCFLPFRAADRNMLSLSNEKKKNILGPNHQMSFFCTLSAQSVDCWGFLCLLSWELALCFYLVSGHEQSAGWRCLLALCSCVIHSCVAGLPDLLTLRLCLTIIRVLGTRSCSAEDLLVRFHSIIHQALPCTAIFVLQ